MTSSDTGSSFPVDAFTGSEGHDMPSSTRLEAVDVSTIFKLIIEDDEGKTIVFPLIEGEFTIGRHDANAICLVERNVSRRHAKVIRKDDAIFVEDLDSYIGVRLNGERIIEQMRISEGDLVEIGDYHLALRKIDSEEEALSSQVTQALPAGSEVTEDRAAEGLDTYQLQHQWTEDQPPDFRLPDELLSQARLGKGHVNPQSTEGAKSENGGRSPLHDTLPERPSAIRREEPTGRRDESTSELPPFPGSTADINPVAPLSARGSKGDDPFLREPVDTEPGHRTGRGPPLVADKPRLVCVNTQYAGQSYSLDRKHLVIGRVDDNDIVIEHRSVSRNHAKLVASGDGQEIHDLQSANGVLVNGEEFAQTRLRSGDLIELGTVRFRFIAPGDAFRANEEEAREMRANGFEPPGVVPGGAPKSESTRRLADSDLGLASTAGTHMGLGARQSSGFGRARTAVITRVPADAGSRPPPPPKRAASRIPSNYSSGIDEDLPYPMPIRGTHVGRRAILGLIAVLSVVVVILLILLLDRGQRTYDRELEALYQQGRYDEVKVYYEAHEREFNQPMKAATLFGRALDRIESPEFDGPGVDAPPIKDSEQSVSKASEALVKEEDTKVTLSLAARTRRATQLSQQGQDALNDNALDQAEQFLTECTKLAPAFAVCHKSLGMLFAAKEQRERSLLHYSRYLELAPDSDDAGDVRAMIKAIKGTNRQ